MFEEPQNQYQKLSKEKNLRIVETIWHTNHSLLELYDQAKELTDDSDPILIASIKCGRKTLKLFFVREECFTTHIQGNGNNIPLENETTLCYEEAKKIMQGLVNESKKNALYILMTQSNSMQMWAETKGELIFHWQKKEIQQLKEGDFHPFIDHTKPLFIAQVTLLPPEQKA